MDKIIARESLYSIAGNLSDAFKKSKGEMTFKSPLMLDDSAFTGDIVTKTITEARKIIETFAAKSNQVVFWQREDRPFEIEISVKVDEDIAITLTLVANQPYKDQGVIKLSFSGYVSIPEGKEELFKEAITRILDLIKTDDNNIVGMIIKYTHRDNEAIFFTVGEALELE
jgi:hypothetical protein